MSKWFKNYASNREILAFVHIEKAAGTTLVDVFRRNFNFRFCEVRPMGKLSGKNFTADDMRKTLLVNPFLCAIAGHAVKPYADLGREYKGIRYITLLRDPLKRYVSHYQYWTERMGKSLHFEDFLKLGSMRNFQTRKVSGGENIDLAKDILQRKVLLTGLVEQFDEFMVMLSRVAPYRFNPVYKQTNKARDRDAGKRILSEYYSDIVEKNKLDMELYDYAVKVVVPKEREDYGPGLEVDLEKFRQSLAGKPLPVTGKYIYYAYKKMYFMPVTGLIRVLNGLPAKGSYGVQR